MAKYAIGMAHIFASNSPQYLEYVARYMTREEIENHPILCQWLNNPYTKDNMELAIRFNLAEDGDYQDKKDFVEYYMCNGPEIDADTMLYYRQKILLDDTYREIAYTYYMNMDVVDYIRKKVYNKSHEYFSYSGSGEEKTNCFKAPCSYLGPISCRAINIEDADENSSSAVNTLAERRDAFLRWGGSQFTNGPATTQDDEDMVPDAEGASGDTPANVKTGGLPKWALHLFPPATLENYNTFIEHRNEQNRHFVRELAKKKQLHKTQVGDSKCIVMSEAWKLLAKANNKRNMGDCDRLLRQVAYFNPHDPSMNKRRPISDTEIVKNTAPDGTPATQVPNPTASDAAPPKEVLSQLMKNGNYKKLVAQAKKTMTGETGDTLDAMGALGKACEIAQKIRESKGGTDEDLRYWVALALAKQNRKSMNKHSTGGNPWSWDELLEAVKSNKEVSPQKLVEEACQPQK